MMSAKIQKYRFLGSFLPSSGKKQLVLITGARQTGKTTLVKDKYRGLKYINLDSPDNRASVRELAAAQWSKDVGNAVLDEAQKEPVIFEKIKCAYDEDGISFSVLLGSSQILLPKKIRESLAGRISIFELWPLLLSEVAAPDSVSAKEVKPRVPLADARINAKKLDPVLKAVASRLLDKEAARVSHAQAYLLRWGGACPHCLIYLMKNAGNGSRITNIPTWKEI